MQALTGSTDLICRGRQAGVKGFVIYVDTHAVAIEAPDLWGASDWYGYWYEREENVVAVKGGATCRS